MYFHNFPEIAYDPTGSGNYNTIQDITTRIKVREWIINNGALFSKYIVSNGDTPEIVAFKEYGSTDYHWVVLLFNQIINNYYGWPLSRRNFDAFVNEKYTNPNGIHSYIIPQSSGGTWIDITVESDVVGATALTNMEYEEKIQDKKAKIRLLKKSYLLQFTNEFQRLVGQKVALSN